MQRKLVTLQQIKAVSPIPDADAIETVSFEHIGWQCVAKKGEFKPGDKCVYFEIDSFLPVEEKYEFLRASSFRTMYTGQDGFKLRSLTMRGQLSQGLALHLSLFPGFEEKEIGEDLTEATGVIKWEQDPGAYEILGDFPGIVEKSDQIRIQVLLDYFERYRDVEFEESMKLDGESATLFNYEGYVGVCGRNNEFKQIKTVPSWNIIEQSGLNIAMSELGRNKALQFELMGPGVQGNREKLSERDLFMFNIWDVKKGRFVAPVERMELFARLAERVREISGRDLRHTPVLSEKVRIFEECPSLEELLDRANGTSLFHKRREGNVYKSLEYLDNERIVQFKVISNDYLLKGGE